MTRLCERPGCSEPGAVAYEIDTGRRVVTLHGSLHPDEERAGVLCRRHADSMVVPRWWTLDDRREATPRLFRPPPRTEVTARQRPGRPRKSATPDATGELALFDDGAVTVAEVAGPTSAVLAVEPDVVDVPDVDETRAIPWNPHFDTDDDLDGLLSAHTPLLARAFGNARRRPRRR